MLDATLTQQLPNDRRNFVHKRIIGAVGGFLGGGPAGAIGGFVGGGGGGGGRAPGARPPQEGIDNMIRAGMFAIPGMTAAEVAARRQNLAIGGFLPPPASFGPTSDPGSPCGFGKVFDVQKGRCVWGLGTDVGPEPGGVGGGQAVMGRYGAALVPDVQQRRHLDCLPGMVLGTDSLCYNRRDIRNKERKYPKGRAPLLTGGERNAITKARGAARKIERTTKALQDMGMIKKPAPRKAAAPRLQLTAGDVHHIKG